ncbi:MAG TPA: hypothetical protein VNN10_00045 [Dehalococcoidia bacterium]|nr:hypothetical protein [Dehalococcoidia bacterium]
MQTRTVPLGSRERRRQACQHHWLIETPDGPTSEGRCKRCGEKKSFLNVFEDVLQAQQENAA